MKLLNHFDGELNAIEKQRVELRERAKLLIKTLREKFPTQHRNVENLRGAVEYIAETEYIFRFLEQYYNDGYHELANGASYRQIVKRYHGDDANVDADPEDYFNLVIEDRRYDNDVLKLFIELDSDMDTIEDIICSID